MKKLNPKPKHTGGIGELESDDDIAELFRAKYEGLYNSVDTDEREMRRIKSIVENRARCTPSAVAAVSTADVVSAVHKLKQMKSDGDRGFMSNHLIFGGHYYFQEIAALVTAMFIHGVQPEKLLKASIISIPKNYSKSGTNEKTKLPTQITVSI